MKENNEKKKMTDPLLINIRHAILQSFLGSVSNFRFFLQAFLLIFPAKHEEDV